MDDGGRGSDGGTIGSEGEAEPAPVEVATAEEQPSQDSGERMLALERARDAKGNEATRPPDGESVSFRSMTVVEMYAGPAIDSLTTALSAMNWVDIDHPVVERIIEAQKGYTYSRGVFWLVEEAKERATFLDRASTTLPTGTDRIYGECYVLGPSLVALVLTFVLGDDEAKRIDQALREDAESRLDRLGGTTFSVKSVKEVKRERVRNIFEDVRERCRTWINATMPGTLVGTQEGLSTPTCALMSLAHDTPFSSQSEYLNLIDLAHDYLAVHFRSPDFLFLSYPLDIQPNNGIIAAFNEEVALAQKWVPDVSAAPEVFHEAISSLVIADGIYAVLTSYGPKMRDVRSSLNRLDFDKATGSEVIALRNRLLSISRDVSTVCGDVTVLVEDGRVIWSDLTPLVPVKTSTSTTALEPTADERRRQLRAVVASLQSQEANLRELILVTSASTSEARGLELQTKVLNLTNKLNGLTTWLIVLTIVLVVLGVAAVLVQVLHSPVVQLRLPPGSHIATHA